MPSTELPSGAPTARIPPLAMRPRTLFYPPLEALPAPPDKEVAPEMGGATRMEIEPTTVPVTPPPVPPPLPARARKPVQRNGRPLFEQEPIQAPEFAPPAEEVPWPRRLQTAHKPPEPAPDSKPEPESSPGWTSLGLWTDKPVPLYRTVSEPVPAPAPAQAPLPASKTPAVVTSSGLRTGDTLLTGATGFVGSAVARALLARGHSIRLLVRPGSDRRNLEGVAAEIVEGDLTNPVSLAAAVAGCRYLLHVAADYRLWVPNPDAMRAANVTGTTSLLRAAHEAGVERMVYCSSVAALGLPGDGTPGTEDTPVQPDGIAGVYKQSKYAAEQAVRAMAAEGVPVVIVNPSAPVGPRDIKPTPTGRMILDAAAGRMPAYVETGLNVVHVDDVAQGMVLALERGVVGEAYILGGEDLGMAHLLALVDDVMGRFDVRRRRLSTGVLQPAAVASELSARIFGTEPRVTREMLAMADKQMFFSSAKAAAALGYTHRPARQAVADAVAWFQQMRMLRA